MADKIAFLSDSRNHPEHPELVEARETHMSWVFLGDHQVYKIKKPARQPALDLRTLAARRRNAAAEIELNRRLAPDVYRGVLPLTFAPGQGLALGGAGEPAEWVVAMRRLPEDLMLDRALREGGPEPRDLQLIVRRLCRFYGSRTPVRQPPGTRRNWFEQEIDLSRRTLERFGRS